jgi:hypothetical protein
LAYIEKDSVSVGISIIPIYTIESLGKLDIAHFAADLGIH